MIPTSLAKKVLTLGPQHLNYRGGIAGVIAKYSRNYEHFNFISTYKEHPLKIVIILQFIVTSLSTTYKLIFDKKIELVHIHVATKGSFFRKYFLFLLAKYIFNKKVVYHNHASSFVEFYNKSPRLLRSAIKHFIESSDLVICLSKQWYEYYNKTFIIKKLVILNNIVEKVANNKETSTLNYPLKFLYLGVIGQRKGTFDLINVITKNKSYLHGKFKLFIGGNGDYKKLLLKIQENDLGDLVEYRGWVSGQEKTDLMKDCNVYILPSYNEGLPLSILEAMAFGMPIISTPVGGTPEIVKNNINGYLHESGNEKQMFHCIKAFIENPSLINEMGMQSLKIVEPFYSENVMIELIKIYKSLIYTH